jgi:hypothetical protein
MTTPWNPRAEAAETSSVFVQVASGRSRRWVTQAVTTTTDNALFFADEMRDRFEADGVEARVRVVTEDDLRDAGGDAAVSRAYGDLDRLAARAAADEG